MQRHDPLATGAPEPEPPPPPPKPGRKKLPPLLRELAQVKDDTLAFLYGGPDQRPGDFERNLSRAAELRRDFTSFCEQNPHYANWRQAWAAYMAQTQAEANPLAMVPPATDAESLEPNRSEWVEFSTDSSQIVAVDFAASAHPSAMTARPHWQQRLRARTTA